MGRIYVDGYASAALHNACTGSHSFDGAYFGDIENRFNNGSKFSIDPRLFCPCCRFSCRMAV